MDRNRIPKIRVGGWTAERQLAFLDALARTRNVRKAAAAAGMSRESAYRLRDRAALFAALWDRALEPPEVHIPPLSDGRLARILGYDFRRKSGDLGRRSKPGVEAGPSDRTRPL